MKHFDKVQHFGVGIIVTAVVAFLAEPVTATAVTIAIAYLKEEFDSYDPLNHTRDGWDAFATAAGIPIGLLFNSAL